jgi:hypothetical protein
MSIQPLSKVGGFWKCATPSEGDEDCGETGFDMVAVVPATPNTTAKAASRVTATRYFRFNCNESSFPQRFTTHANKALVEDTSMRKIHQAAASSARALRRVSTVSRVFRNANGAIGSRYGRENRWSLGTLDGGLRVGKRFAGTPTCVF